ncbi:MAG TPA: DUF1592 domain-containing protein [Bryobacteraceae bacterium]|nr:DUF1592 domain-containing protein [Bryobacteraceae bacterium]
MRLLHLFGICFPLASLAAPASDEFSQSLRPVLAQNCGGCHSPDNPKNRIDFLKAATAEDIEKNRGMWRSVAAQLRNRTMPPVASKITEDQRLHISSWITDRLRTTACSGGDYAGTVTVRRLNRREYHNTLRDLLGVDLPVADIFPRDGSGGEGFDTNGETLYIPPILMEKYMEAAQQVLDRAIITPPLHRAFPSAQMEPPQASVKPGRILSAGQEVSATLPIFLEGQYDLRVSVERPRENPFQMEVKVDGLPAGSLTFQKDANGGPTTRAQVFRLSRGAHTISVKAGEFPVDMYSLTVEQRQPEPSAEKRAVHFRLFGMEPGKAPLQPRKAADRLLSEFMAKAYRRPVTRAEVDRVLALYDRTMERGDAYEESVKLALKAVLVSPNFLFRNEEGSGKPGIHPLGQHELASRLSYFLWSTMPDEELRRLAAEGKLQDAKVLSAQVERMLDDPRSRSFADAFMGQWIGTEDVGGRVVPLLTELQHFYTPEVAADLREQPVLMFHHILSENRSLLDLLDAGYTFLTGRLVKFYEMESSFPRIEGDLFQRVQWPDKRRGGLFGLGAVLAMTSHYKQTSPVLRGAWVLDALLGTPVPPPPPDVPPLERRDKTRPLTIRQTVEKHRADPACSACHKLMDPIGFALENFDWMGRWRDKEDNGQPIDASGELPSGEKFNGPVELRQALLGRKDEFLRHVAAKTLGYALGRRLEDADQCTVQQLVDSLQKINYGARMLIHNVVLSIPFRNSQGGLSPVEPPPPRTRKRPRPPEEK